MPLDGDQWTMGFDVLFGMNKFDEDVERFVPKT
jgi:hypothetical protein